MSKLGDRLKELSYKHGPGLPTDEAYAAIAEAFANEVRHDAIPWAHAALDDLGAPRGPDIAGRIRVLAPAHSQAHEELTRHGVPNRGGLVERIRTLAAQRNAPVLTENALNACKAFDAPTDPSDAVVYLATRICERDCVLNELRAIIVEAIKGGGESK